MGGRQIATLEMQQVKDTVRATLTEYGKEMEKGRIRMPMDDDILQELHDSAKCKALRHSVQSGSYACEKCEQSIDKGFLYLQYENHRAVEQQCCVSCVIS